MKESLKDLYHGHTTVAGKKLLFIRTEALQHMFGDESIAKYQDLWRENGAVERRAWEASSGDRRLAVHYFRESLKIRERQAADHGSRDAGSGRPDGHQQMCNALGDCIKRIEGMDKRARSQVAWPALHAFALLRIDDDDDDEC